MLFTSARQWQTVLTEKAATHVTDPQSGALDLIRSRHETRLQEVNWDNSAALRRQPGLSPDQKSMLFLLTNNVIVTIMYQRPPAARASPTAEAIRESNSRGTSVQVHVDVHEFFDELVSNCFWPFAGLS